MANVLLPPISDLTQLTTAHIAQIQNKEQIPDSSILVVSGNPVGIIVAGHRIPRQLFKAVVLVNDPHFPDLANSFQEVIGRAQNYAGASILFNELIANTRIDPRPSAAFERGLDDTWSSEAYFLPLKACPIFVCESFAEATQLYPNNPCEFYFQNESDMPKPISPSAPLDLAQSAFLFGFPPEEN